MSLSHIDGVAVSGLSHIQGIAKANVSEINGQTAGFGGGDPADPVPKSLVFCCGLECGKPTGPNTHVQASSGTASTVSTTTVRTGERSLRVNVSSGNSASVIGDVTITTVSVFRFYIRFATLPSGDALLAWRGSSSAAIGVSFKASDSTIRAATNTGQTMGSTGVTVTTGVWYLIDVKTDGTAGAKVSDVQVDGVAVGQSTHNDGSSAGTTWFVGNRNNGASAVTGDWFYDDLAISNTSADYPIGAGVVYRYAPTADGAHNTGAAGSFTVGAGGANITNATTDSYQYLDEAPLPTRNTTPTAGDFITQTNNTGGDLLYVEHTWGPAGGAPSATFGPRCIAPNGAYHSASSGTADAQWKIVDGATSDTIATLDGIVGAAETMAMKFYAVMPADGQPWTLSRFNGLKTRFGFSSDASPDMAIDTTMIEAEFSS